MRFNATSLMFPVQTCSLEKIHSTLLRQQNIMNVCLGAQAFDRRLTVKHLLYIVVLLRQKLMSRVQMTLVGRCYMRKRRLRLLTGGHGVCVLFINYLGIVISLCNITHKQ